ncbi:MAG: septation protein [Candidatus Midichloriaceae bacterium]|jgi:intracellular septation protein|nr:septation protein [Candidatus Midichloriaceae bacterium]
MPLHWKAILEFLPMGLFFLTYKIWDIRAGVITLVISTIVALLISKYKRFKLPKLMLLGYGIIIIFGLLTVVMDDTFFIKIKPTIINLTVALLLLLDRFKRNNKKLVLLAIPVLSGIPKKKLDLLLLLWSLYFASCALANEFIWRNFDEQTWVYFKVFGLTSMSILFFMINAIALKDLFLTNQPTEAPIRPLQKLASDIETTTQPAAEVEFTEGDNESDRTLKK